jgi:hypothetical protein
MAQTRFFVNTAEETTLSGNIGSGDLTFTVAGTSGWPVSYPFNLVIDFEAVGAELVAVSNVSGTTVTCTRGQDNTTATSHSSGARVVHGPSARDFNEANLHIQATTDAHGLSGGASFVGTSTTQTLTNKTISGASNTLTNIPAANVTGTFSSVTVTGAATVGSVVSSGAVSGTTGTFSGAVSATTLTGTGAVSGTTLTGTSTVQGTDLVPTGLTGATQASRYVGATATGAPSSGTFAIGDFVIARDGAIWICNTAGTPGTWEHVGDDRFLKLTGGTLTGALIGIHGNLFDASADGIVMDLKGHSTQTNPILRIRNDADANLFTVDNSGKVFQKVPIAYLERNTSSQSINNSTDTAVSWNGELLDNDAAHDNAVNPSRYTVKTAGYFRVDATIEWAGNSTGNRFLFVRKNGVATNYLFNNQSTVSAFDWSQNTSGVLPVSFAVNDYIEVFVSQTSGGALNVTTDSWATIQWVSSV